MRSIYCITNIYIGIKTSSKTQSVVKSNIVRPETPPGCSSDNLTIVTLRANIGIFVKL